MNLAAFDSVPASAPFRSESGALALVSAYEADASISADDVFDSNGLWVPHFWRMNVQAWEKLALCVREKFSRERLQEHRQALAKEAAKKPKAPRAYAPNFTTQYAVAWGRKQGWKEIDRERYDRLAKRHHDLQLGMDVMFEGPDGVILVQGAGKSERKAHYDRFITRGGPEKARRRGFQIVYVEFVREDRSPIKEEWWVRLIARPIFEAMQ